MDEISYSGSSASRKKRRISKRLVTFGLIAVIVLVLIGGIAYFVTRKGDSENDGSAIITLPEEQQKTENTPTPEASITPAVSVTPSASKSPTPKTSVSPTKSPSVSDSAKSDIKVVIQNGSGESGVAGKASDVMKAAGYTVVSTGNADNFDYKDVTVRVKPSQKSNLAAIEKALSTNYTVGDTSSDLSEGQSYDVLVIIGK